MFRKQEKIVVPLFLNDYHTTHVGLLVNGTLCASRTCPNTQSNARLLIMLDELLATAGVSLDMCEALGVYAGPGPFTTLRTVIATVNGLAWSGIAWTGSLKPPILAVHGMRLVLWTIAKEHNLHEGDLIFAVLPAFCRDVYYGWFEVHGHDLLHTIAHSSTTGFCSEEAFCAILTEKQRQKKAETTVFVGGLALTQNERLRQLDPTLFVKSAVTMPTLNDLALAIMLADKDAYPGIVDRTTLCEPLYIKPLSF